MVKKSRIQYLSQTKWCNMYPLIGADERVNVIQDATICAQSMLKDMPTLCLGEVSGNALCDLTHHDHGRTSRDYHYTTVRASIKCSVCISSLFPVSCVSQSTSSHLNKVQKHTKSFTYQVRAGLLHLPLHSLSEKASVEFSRRMLDFLKRKAKQALAKALVHLPHDASTRHRRAAQYSMSVKQETRADKSASTLPPAALQLNADAEIVSDQTSSTRTGRVKHDSALDHADSEDAGAAVVTVRDRDGRLVPALLLDDETRQSFQISINAYQRDRRYQAQKTGRDDDRDVLRKRVLEQVYNLDEMLSRSLRSGDEVRVIEGIRDLQYQLLDHLSAIEEHQEQERSRKIDLEDERLYQDAQVLRRVGEAFHAAGLVGLRSDSDSSLAPFDTALLEDFETAGALSSLADELQRVEPGEEQIREQKEAESYKRRLNDVLDDWDYGLTDDAMWVLFRATIISRRKIRRYAVLRNAILMTCEDSNGGQEAADARELTDRILDSINAHRDAVNAYVERVAYERIPWPLIDPRPLPYEDFEDIGHWLEEMATMKDALADPERLSEYGQQDFKTKYVACNEAQKAARMRLRKVGIEYDQMRRAEEAATVEELYRNADRAYDVKEEAQVLLNDEVAIRREEGEKWHPDCLGPYLRYLLNNAFETKTSFFVKRMTFEKYGDMQDFKTYQQSDEDTSEASSTTTLSVSRPDDYLNDPATRSNDGKESVIGFPGCRVGKEPTFARWKYGLGPFNPGHVDASSRGWEGVDGVLSGTFSDCSSYDGDESDLVLVEKWRAMADKNRAAVEGLLDKYLDGVAGLFNE